MSQPTIPPEQEPEHEPMPDSWKPVWRFMGLMFLLTVAIGIAAAIIDLLVREV
ncbi:MAG: hypothetical protein Q8J78_10315 [Moraxellaceae bacterium]|nr:hypothetical protein [Moraxellaceae bacterium]